MLYIYNGKILIKKYQNVMTLRDDLFECMMEEKKIVSVRGKNIEMRYFGEDEILLYGQFSQISML